MKNLALIIVLLGIFIQIQAQDNTIKNLEIRIEAAALEEDYAKAAALTKEKDLRVGLKEAVEAKDYERAAEIKEELNALENDAPATSNTSSSSSSSVKVSNASKTSGASNSALFSNGPFVDAVIGISPRTLSKVGLGAFGLKVGSKWYFGNGSVYRPGLQAVWFKPVVLFNTNGGGVLLEVNALNLGLANGIAINDHLGIEINLGFGFSHLIASFSNYAYANGLNITPDVKFRKDNLAVGLEFSNSIYFNNAFSINTYSITIGGKF